MRWRGKGNSLHYIEGRDDALEVIRAGIDVEQLDLLQLDLVRTVLELLVLKLLYLRRVDLERLDMGQAGRYTINVNNKKAWCPKASHQTQHPVSTESLFFPNLFNRKSKCLRYCKYCYGCSCEGMKVGGGKPVTHGIDIRILPHAMRRSSCASCLSRSVLSGTGYHRGLPCRL